MQSSGAFSLARRTNAWYAGTGCEKLKNVELPEITIAPGFLSDKDCLRAAFGLMRREKSKA